MLLMDLPIRWKTVAEWFDRIFSEKMFAEFFEFLIENIAQYAF